MLLPGFVMSEDVTVDSMHSVKVMLKDHAFKLCKGVRMPKPPQRPGPIHPPKGKRKETKAAIAKRQAASKLRIEKFERHLLLHQRLAVEHMRFKLTPAAGTALDLQYRNTTSPPGTFAPSNAPYRLCGHMKCADWLSVLRTEALPVLLHTRIEDSAFQAISSMSLAIKNLVTLEYIRDKEHLVGSTQQHIVHTSFTHTNIMLTNVNKSPDRLSWNNNWRAIRPHSKRTFLRRNIASSFTP